MLKYPSRLKLSIDAYVLGEMCSCGIPLIRGLKVLSSQNPHFNEHWSKMAEELEGGSMFHEAIAKIAIPGITVEEKTVLLNLVHAGELSGVLDVVLTRYGKEYFKTDDTRIAFLRYLSLLISCGVPILKAIEVTPTGDNTALELLKQDIYESVKKGETLSDPFRSYHLYPEFVIAMIDAGEQTGALPELMQRAADLMQEIETRIALNV